MQCAEVVLCVSRDKWAASLSFSVVDFLHVFNLHDIDSSFVLRLHHDALDRGNTMLSRRGTTARLR